MKWLKIYVFRSKIFWGYFFLFLGLAVFVISGLEISWVHREMEHKRQLEIELMQSKVESIALDIEEQMTEMRKVVLKIISGEEFRNYYRNSNAYYKIEIMRDMREEAEKVSLVNEYFLMYPGKKEILSNYFGSVSFVEYVKYRFGNDAVSHFDTLFMQEYMYSGERLLLYRYEDTVFFIFPFNPFYDTARPETGGMFVYVMQEKEFADRAEQLAGYLNGGLYIACDDFRILGDLAYLENAGQSAAGQTELSAVSGDILVRLFLKEGSEHSLFEKGILRKTLQWFLASVALALGLAYIISLPIHKLSQKIGIYKNYSSVLDWKNIEKELEKLLYSNEKYNEEQYRILQQQIIRLIVSGKYTESFSSFLLFFHIRSDYLLYSVFECKLGDIEIDNEERIYILERLEELSDSDSALYTYWEEDKVKILAGTEDRQQMEAVKEKIRQLFIKMQVFVTLELIESGESLDTIKGSKASDYEQEMDLQNSENKVSILTQKAIKYMKEHCLDIDISLDHVADYLHITPSYLSRIIKKELGVNYKEYITSLKMEKAKEILLEENASVMGVCEKIGYASTSYFIRVFKNHTGMTPDRWRRQHGLEMISESEDTLQ